MIALVAAKRIARKKEQLALITDIRVAFGAGPDGVKYIEALRNQIRQLGGDPDKS